MRVSIARIRLYLKTSKKLADGSSPVMLMCCFNNARKEISTSYSCTQKYWNKAEQCIKKGYPNYLMINQSIKKLKDDAISIRDEYEANGEVYTPSMILTPRKVLSAVTNDLKSLISNYIAEKCNERIAALNVAGNNIPLIDLDCRYYSYRHSFIMKEIQKPGVNLLALAQTVGKSSHTLHQYISLLGDVDLI